ncbi:hypothetical protein ACJRO7_023578 [Eucalyptus globulus]|uniref:Uncharacterized protein n=1 Tax=Eucalyptus globulus TaxID=34317 RepID=A0ABD3K4R9_EUCGL
MQVVGMRKEEGGRGDLGGANANSDGSTDRGGRRDLDRVGPADEVGEGYFGAPTDDSESATGRETSEARRERIGFFRLRRSCEMTKRPSPRLLLSGAGLARPGTDVESRPRCGVRLEVGEFEFWAAVEMATDNLTEGEGVTADGDGGTRGASLFVSLWFRE